MTVPPLERFSGCHVLVVGDVMLDRFVYGEVSRISPEAPIPVLRAQRDNAMPGGAGNTVRNLTSLGAQATIVSVTGRDGAGEELAELLHAMPDVTPMLITDPARPTTQKTRFIAGSQQMLRSDIENAAPIAVALEDRVLQHVQDAIGHVDIVLLSDYAKGTLTDRVTAAIIALAQEHGKRVMIDPKGRNYARYRGAFMLTPNRRELAEAAHLEKIASIEQAEQAARVLLTAYRVEMILAKLGADGVCLVPAQGEARHVPAQAREVFDVSGAGDTVIATMALGLAAGFDPFDAARVANAAGSVVVGKIGTATVTAEEVAHALREGDARAVEKKIVGWQEAQERVERWRVEGKKIGFTNGFFDLIHPGHVSLLRQARTRCDRLVLGLNSDASAKRQRGGDELVQSELARATVLASMHDVDMVVIFDQDTPVELIRALRPALLVKGADYTPETVVGWPDVQSWGGELFLADLGAEKNAIRRVHENGAAVRRA